MRVRLSRRWWGLVASLLFGVGAATVTFHAFTDGPLTPLFDIRGRTDENGYLRVSIGTAGLTDGALTPLSVLRGRTDENGYLRVSLSGSGFAPTDATYITQTPNSTLSAEQALSALATGLLNVTTTTGVVSSFAPTDDNLLVGSGTVWALKALTDCQGAGKAVTYTVSTNAFGCNTISGASFAGSGSEIQVRSTGTTVAAVTSSSYDGTTLKLPTPLEELAVGVSPGTYTLANSGLVMKDGSGNEIWRIWGTDPDEADFNSGNMFVGFKAGDAQTTNNVNAGFFNSGVGFEALSLNQTGNYNTALGTYALGSVTTSENTAVGYSALYIATTGYRNTGVGSQAIGSLETGHDNTAIGADAMYSADGVNNSTAIGAGVEVSGSNQVVIGNASVTDVYFGSISATSIAHALRYVGQLLGRYTSSGSAPTVANVGANSCGTTAAAMESTSNDNAGSFTVGATAGTQCRLTMTSAAPNKWACTPTNTTTANLARFTPVDTTHVDFLGTFVAADVISYVCTPR